MVVGMNVEPANALNLDLAQQQSFVRFYRNLPEKPGVTIRIFNRSDYFTVHDEDATFAAQCLFGTHTIKYMGEAPKLSYLVLNRGTFETFLRDLLLVKQYRVELYVKGTSGKNNDWILEYKGSPGNLSQFEQVLFENNEIIFNSVIMALKIIKNTTIAVACINSTENQLYVSEFNDNELFTELEAFLAQVGPKECLLPQGNTTELNTLKTMLDRSGCLVAIVKKSEYNANDIDQDLNRLLHFLPGQQKNAKALPEYDLTEAMGCLQALIKYLNLSGEEINFNQYKLTTFDAHHFVRLDSAAIYALNLLPQHGKTQNEALKKYGSVLGVLNRCCTAQGHRLLEQWVKQPLKDLNLINERLEVVEALIKDPETRNILCSNYLKCIADLLMLSKKVNSKKVKLQDCYRVYQTITKIPPVVNALRSLDNKYVKDMLVDPLSDLLLDMDRYQTMIESTIDFDLVDRGEFLIIASYDPELQGLADEKKVIEEKMQKTLHRTALDLRLEAGKSIKLERTDQHGYFFRVTLRDEPVLRENSDYRIIDAIKGGVRFVNDRLYDLNNDYSDLMKQYEVKQRSVVDEIFEIAASYSNTLRTINLYVAKVDILVSFANVAANAPIPFVRPKLHKEGSGILKLKRNRHPCLEMQDGVTFIPNDVHFKSGEKHLHIITGPNMGGKSTYIRSIGVTVLMAQIGSFVPCAEAEISLVDSILARVGANDSQVKGLSTFMLEMVETSSIIKTATSNSLVIIDELGRGTSTYDGCGIAWAIAEHLATVTKCFSLFATHFHEIAELAEQHSTIHNSYVTVVTTETTITPLFQVREGACDKSYGIHCARMAGISDEAIAIAKREQELLEDAEGMEKIKNFDVTLKRKILVESDSLIDEAVEECRKLDLKKLPDEEVIDKLKAIKKNLLSKDNPFLEGLLGSKNNIK